MTPKTKEVLEAYKYVWETLRDAGYIKHLTHEVKTELHEAYHELVNKDEHITLWCDDCVADMVTRLYLTYEKTQPAVPNPATTLTIETAPKPVPVENPKGKPEFKKKHK